MQTPDLNRRTFLAGASAALTGAALRAQGATDAPHLTHGPFLTHKQDASVEVWARASEPGEYQLFANDPVAADAFTVTALARPEDDLTLRWSLDLLKIGPYRVEVRDAQARPIGTSWDLSRAPFRSTDTPASLAIGSCADERKFPDQPVWDRMRERTPDLVALIGDTPYIDTTELDVQRERYRAFYSQPQLAALLREVPFAGTWDDHDFAGNDRFGAVEGREDSRRAFLEYHGPGEWGLDGRGVFTKRRVGPIELYLLDTRWFADTEPSPFDASKQTLLGAAQWRWLQQELLASSAPIKLLACGMVWNDAVRPGKADYWGRWPHERAALFEWLGRKEISGVVLVSGDVHRTRVIRHATKDVVGYDLVELVTSPIANTVIESNAAEHPGLLFDRGVEHSFLAVSATPKGNEVSLRAEMVDGAGATMYAFECMSPDLRKRA